MSLARSVLLGALMLVAPRIRTPGSAAQPAAGNSGGVLAAYGTLLAATGLLIAYTGWSIWNLGRKPQPPGPPAKQADRNGEAADEPKQGPGPTP